MEVGGNVERGAAHSFLPSVFLPLFCHLAVATPPPPPDPFLGLAFATLALLHFPPLSLIAIRNPIPAAVLDSALHSLPPPADGDGPTTC